VTGRKLMVELAAVAERWRLSTASLPPIVRKAAGGIGKLLRQLPERHPCGVSPCLNHAGDA